MDKNEKLIMVVKRETLFKDDHFEGFKPQDGIDFESRILENYEYVRRGDAEGNPSYKQPIGYAMIFNPYSRKLFAYQRSSDDSKYSEKRLQGKWSWGVGGHIEKIDIKNGNPIRESMLREVTKEEIEMSGSVMSTKALGYINDDSNDVGKVHFGILYLIKTDSSVITPKDPEIKQGKLMSLYELESIFSQYSVEEWSKIAFDPLKKHIIQS